MGQRHVQVRPAPSVAGHGAEPLQRKRMPLCHREEGVCLVLKTKTCTCGTAARQHTSRHAWDAGCAIVSCTLLMLCKVTGRTLGVQGLLSVHNRA